MSTRGKVSKFLLLNSLTLQKFFSAFSALFCIQSLSEFMSTYRAHCILGSLSQKPSSFPGPFLGGKESTLSVSRSPPPLSRSPYPGGLFTATKCGQGQMSGIMYNFIRTFWLHKQCHGRIILSLGLKV